MSSELHLIAVSGDLGSGKSTVARRIAKVLGVPYVSTGSLHRSIARQRKLTTLELNRAAERDSSIDQFVDDTLRDIAKRQESVVVDSRLAWWLIPDVRSVHLLVDPAVGAARAHHRYEETESYGSPAEARIATRRRAESEQNRFDALYGVDILRLRNYDIVIDTTSASPEQVGAEILRRISTVGRTVAAPIDKPNVLLVDPRRIYPTEMITVLRDLDPASTDLLGSTAYLAEHPIDVIYSKPFFAAVDGHKRLSSAILQGLTWIPCRLIGERSEQLLADATVDEYFRDVLGSSSRIYDWNEVHDLSLDVWHEF